MFCTKKVLSTFLRTQFGRVNMRERQNRMNDLAVKVFNYCVDIKIKEDGTNYNRDIAIHVLNLIDNTKKVIEQRKTTKVKFQDIEDITMDAV